MKMTYTRATTTEELLPVLKTLEPWYPLSEGTSETVRFTRLDATFPTLKVSNGNGVFHVEYSSLSAALRGIGSVLAGLECEEETPFITLGIMLDCSRNRVLTVEQLKTWFRRLALAGYNLVMLYTEDTYQLPSEPFFGFMRGAYSLAEIQELDDYAYSLGIELRGCIQTLGHLDKVLRWGAYSGVRDTGNVLLAESPDTYRLIEKMVEFWAHALRARTLHIGMDETYDLGRCVYLDKHGHKPQFDLFNGHLVKVREICAATGLSAEMWSDMYFRIGSKGEYYNPDLNLTKAQHSLIPQDVKLWYWDYYNTEVDFYERMIDAHRKLSGNISVASGIWTWARFWCDTYLTTVAAMPCIEAARKKRIHELVFALWGDDGAYCLMDSAFAMLMLAAEVAYGSHPGTAQDSATKRLRAVCDMDFDAIVNIGQLNAPFVLPDGSKRIPRDGSLLWDDPLLGVSYLSFSAGFPNCAQALVARYESIEKIGLASSDYARSAELPIITSLVRILKGKVQYHASLRDAYARRDKVTLRRLADEAIPELIHELDIFSTLYRNRWLETSMPFGLELIQGRNASLATRFEEARTRIIEFLEGKIRQIDELENIPEFTEPF